jgi:hypothetical protein
VRNSPGGPRGAFIGVGVEGEARGGRETTDEVMVITWPGH